MAKPPEDGIYTIISVNQGVLDKENVKVLKVLRKKTV